MVPAIRPDDPGSKSGGAIAGRGNALLYQFGRRKQFSGQLSNADRHVDQEQIQSEIFQRRFTKSSS